MTTTTKLLVSFQMTKTTLAFKRNREKLIQEFGDVFVLFCKVDLCHRGVIIHPGWRFYSSRIKISANDLTICQDSDKGGRG